MTRAIVTGDLHLFHDGTNYVAVDALVDEMTSNPPDVLVLGGDIYELWRRDLSGATWMSTDFTDAVLDLKDGGTEVVYVAGNHDDYLLRHLADDPRYPFSPVLDHRMTLDGTDFFITHGHKYEPAYNPIVNDVLALADDHAGRLADNLWKNRPLPHNPIERVGLFLAGPAAEFLDPENMKESGLRKRFIESGIRRESPPDEWGIFGHTHDPYVDEEARIANWGSMTAGQATYIEIEDGEPYLRVAGE